MSKQPVTRDILPLQDGKRLSFPLSSPFLAQVYSGLATSHPSPCRPANSAILDLERVTETTDWQTLQTDLRKQSIDPNVLPAIRRLLGHLAPFPRTLATFVGKFTQIINPYEGDFTIIWGLVDLNLKVLGVQYPVVQSMLIKR